MTEALIAQLGRVGALSVISRTSSMRYKRSDKSAPQIARELGVDALVEGSILRAGDRVRITAQLIHAPSDRHLWAESYERDLHDILALQGDVAQAIAREVEIKLTPGQRRRLSTTRALDPAAREAYLKGRFSLNRHTPEGYGKAIEYFETAIQRDPDYILAHSGLAQAYALLPEYMEMAPRDALPHARAAVTRALELDEGSAEAHTSVGHIRYWYDRDWAGAEAAFRRAIELNPSYADAHRYYGDLLIHVGRSEEALAVIRRSLELDPLSLDSRSILWQLYLARGRPDLATEQLLEALELDPNYPIGNMWLGVSYSHLSLHEKAVAQLERAVEVSGQERALWPELAYVYARSGRTNDARQVVGEAEERSRFEYVMPMLMAEVFTALGDHEEMFSWLERAYRERDQSLRAVGWHPAFEGVRSDPRFQDLLRRMNYPGAS